MIVTILLFIFSVQSFGISNLCNSEFWRSFWSVLGRIGIILFGMALITIVSNWGEFNE